MSSKDPGTYTLLINVSEAVMIRVGALDDLTFHAGGYTYTGSAFGPGGLKRVTRHRQNAATDNPTRHWHIDYLLTADRTSIHDVLTLKQVDAECSISQQLPGDPVSDFGCSDCDCDAHLYRFPTVDAAEQEVSAVYHRFKNS